MSSNALWRWLSSTPNRSFAVYPVIVILVAWAADGGHLRIVPWGAVLLIWGYAQYRFVGQYRTRMGGGGPGPDVPPDRVVDTGPYRFTRNPMYLGHLIFMLGLAITFRSWLALALLLFHIVWFHRRVLNDEAHLTPLLGAPYEDYMRRVKRWIPGVV